MALSTASFVILARLLTPADLGLFSVAAATVGVAQVVREFGIGGYLIQERELTLPRIRTAFTISLLISIGLGVIVLVSAKPVSAFYNEPRLNRVLDLLAINFVLIPFGSIGLTLLRRDLAFGRIFVINTVASSIGLGVAVTLGLLGYGYWALAWSSIAGTLALCFLTASLSSHGIAYRLSLAGWGRVVRYGSRSTAVAIVTEIAINANDLVIGKAVDLTAVSIFSRAQALTRIFNRDFLGAVTAVASPAFARLHRSGENVEALHEQGVLYVTAIAWPYYGFVAIFPLEVLRLLFGPQWDAAAPLVPVFCLGGAMSAPSALIITLLASIGRIDLALKADLVSQPLRIMLALACAFLVPTLMGFAIAYVISMALATIIFFLAKHSALPNDLRLISSQMMRNGLITAITLAGPAAISIYGKGHPFAHTWFMLLVAGACATVAWVLASKVLQSPIYSDPLFVELRRRVRGKRARRARVEPR